MKYMGSKSRIAKYIVPILQKYIDENNITKYFEPFVGGANIIDKIKCEQKFASDKNKYLIALLEHVKQGLPLYSTVPKELYDKARAAFYNKNSDNFEDWEIGNIGFLASYNGRFFDGGYAKSGYEKTKNGFRFRDYYNEAKNNLLKQSISLQNIRYKCCDYVDTHPSDCLVYCDPPYLSTKQYLNAKSFNYDLFWETMSKWSQNNIVIISEQQAPQDFICIWEQKTNRSINAKNKMDATEKLFLYKFSKILTKGLTNQ